MNNKFKNIFIVLIVLSGLFCFGGAWDAYTLKFNFQNQNNSFYVAQLSFFWLITGLFGAYLVYTKNKYMGAMVALLSFGLFKTFLCDHAPKTYMYESALIGYSFFIIYYFIRHFEFKENMLKWLMIPASINIFIVFIQAFDKSPIPFLNTSQVSGLLGNEGMAGVYLGLISIVFLKYWKLGYFISLIAIILCDGFVGLIAAIVGGLFYLFFDNKKLFILFLILFLFCGAFTFKYLPGQVGRAKENARLRICMLLGTLDGIKHNPISGWGVGSFIPVVSKILPKESEHFGTRFNTTVAIMNHPHNEVLSGWWKVGIGFPILVFLIVINLCSKFEHSNILSFSMLLSGAITSMFWFFPPPALMVLILTIAIYENEQGGHYGKKDNKRITKSRKKRT